MEKNETELISVVMPAYNAEAYLEEALESVCNQSWKNLELIVVDDGSTDNTPAILSEWQKRDSRIRIVKAANGGVSKARNTGIWMARGKWISFIDSDDILHPRTLETLMGEARKGGYRIVCSHFTTDRKQLGKGNGRCRDVPGEALACGLLYQTLGMKLCPVGHLFDRRVFEEGQNGIAIRFPEGIRYEDLEMIPRLFAREAIIGVVSMNFYYYRQHSESFVNRFNPGRLDSLKAVASLHRHLDKRSAELQMAVNDRELSANFNCFLNIARRPEYRETAVRCWQRIKELRWQSLLNPRVRLKNKLGCLLSLPGRRFLALFSSKPGKPK